LGGLGLLTDPTFDASGTAYPTPAYTLRKNQGPALPPDQLGRVDAVLLSHDHHFDNLDRAGRGCLSAAGRVLTTSAGPSDSAPVREVGPAHLTMAAEEAVAAARELKRALIVPPKRN
jgi:hypothetical protein